jgi:hypothetical protein
MKLFFLLLFFIAITPAESIKRPRWIHPRLPSTQETGQIRKSIQKSTVQIPVSVGTQYNFTVFDFTNPNIYPAPTKQLPATARFKQNCNGTDVTVWVEDATYNSSTINNLNDDTWYLYGSLKRNRDYHISTIIGPAICNIIVPESLTAFGSISELDGQIFSGVNFLLYNIPDDYDASGEYFAGFFDQFDQDKFNLLHMDIYPGNPAGRPDSKNAPRNEFFHVMAHELQHLIHHQKREPHSPSAWLDEGLAQFAIYRILDGKTYPGSTELMFNAQNETPGQVYWYLKNGATNPVYMFRSLNINEYFSIEYYGFAYLFYTHLWQNISSDTAIADAFMRRLVTEPVGGSISFKQVLADYGFTLEDVFIDFAISQYMDGLHYNLNFANLDNEYVTRFQTAELTIDNNSLYLPRTIVSNLRNYSTAYIPIKKSTNKVFTVNLRSECPYFLSENSCNPNEPPEFNVITLPTINTITQCKSSNNPESCLYPSRLFQKYSGNNINIPIKESEQVLLFYTTKNSVRLSPATEWIITDWNGINIRLQSITNTLTEATAVFNSLPPLTPETGELRINYETNPEFSSLNPEFSFRTHRFHKWQKITDPALSAPQNTADNSFALSWNYYEKTTATAGLLGLAAGEEVKTRLELAEESLESSLINSFPLMTSSFQFGTGWNMLAWFPRLPQQNLGDFFTELTTRVSLDPVFYSYSNGSFHCHELSTGACAVLTETTIPFHDEIPAPGTGFFIKSLENKEVLFEHLKPSRRRLNLSTGWNLGSLFYESPALSPETALSPRIPLAYHYNSQTQSWQRIYSGIGKNLATELSTEQSAISIMQAHWIYSPATETFTAPLPALPH